MYYQVARKELPYKCMPTPPRTRIRLTDRQFGVLNALVNAEADGHVLTLRELSGRFGWSAIGTAQSHLRALVHKGMVEQIPRVSRGLRVTPLGRSTLARTLRSDAEEWPGSLTSAALGLMELLAPWLQPRTYAKGALLWQEGDRADRLVIVDAGRLRAFRQLSDGRVVTVLQFGRGEVLGFAPFFDEGGYPASVEAMEAARIRFVVRQDLIRAMREPRIAMGLLGFLAGRLRKAFDTIEQLSLHRAIPRVAAALLPLIKGEDYRFLTLPHSSKAFAEALGLAPATLSRTLAQLASQGVLHRLGPRRYQVLLATELARLAEGEENTLR